MSTDLEDWETAAVRNGAGNFSLPPNGITPIELKETGTAGLGKRVFSFGPPTGASWPERLYLKLRVSPTP